MSIGLVVVVDAEAVGILISGDETPHSKVGGNYMAGFEFVIDPIPSQDYLGTATIR